MLTPLLPFKELEGSTDLKEIQKYNRSNNGAIESFHNLIKCDIKDCKFIGDVERVSTDDYISHIHDPYVMNLVVQFNNHIPSNCNARMNRGSKASVIPKKTVGDNINT